MKHSIKLLGFLLISLFLLSPILAEQQTLYGKTNEIIQIVQSHPNMSSCNITKISYPNQTIVYTIIPMLTTNNINYYYSFNLTQQNGNYIVTTCGNGDGILDCMDYNIEISPTGIPFEISQSYLFIGLLLLFILFLIGGIWGLSRAINGAWQITYICLAYLSLFSIFFISWLYSNNYLWQTPILASIFWILWLIMGSGFLPFIFIVGTYIVGKGIKDNLFKQYKMQGYTDEEAREMAKSRRR